MKMPNTSMLEEMHSFLANNEENLPPKMLKELVKVYNNLNQNVAEALSDMENQMADMEVELLDLKAKQ